MSYASNGNFTFPIQISFIYFSSLIVMTRTFKNILNNSGEGRHPCLVPDLKASAFSFLPLRMRFVVDLSYMDFIMLR